jgi:transcriptional regulator with PAS, ATPase and Fis domain
LLDEIGDMPVTTQAKLLRVLEDGRVRRLGGKSEVQLDVRVIASTNSPLDGAIREGRFREDLFYRLNVFPIPLPSLRERRGDLPVLVAALLEDLNRKHSTKVTDVVPAVLDRFHAYHWPGNIRELRNVLERAVILAGEGTIQAVHLPPGFGGAPMPPSAPASDGNELRVPVGHTIEQAERALIELTLAHTKQNKTRAAEILGISQKTLFNKLKEYGPQ